MKRVRWAFFIAMMGSLAAAEETPQDCFRALPLKELTFAQQFENIHHECDRKKKPCACLDEARIELLVGNSARAKEILEPLCQSGKEKHACFFLGTQLARKRLYEPALDAFSRSCKSGIKDSCDQAASIKGLLDKFKETQTRLQTSCDGGAESDCKLLSSLMEDFDKATKTPRKDKETLKLEAELTKYFDKKDPSPRAAAAYQGACANGIGLGCEYFGRSRESVGEKEEAVVFYRKGCDLKQAASCTLLGNVLAFNDRVADAKEAFQKGCDLDSLESCLNLARLEQVQGVSESAKRLFRLVCEGSSDGKGCLELANLEEKEGNRGLAKFIYQRTCQRKVGEACVRWGVMEKIVPAPTRNPWFKDLRR